MSASFDYFVGELRCACGAVTAGARSNAQTKLRDHPDLAELGAGAPLELSEASARDAGYAVLRPIDSPKTRILQVWECPACGTPQNWLEVTLRAGRIASVESVALGEALPRANFAMEEDLIVEAASRSGRSSSGMTVEEALGLLA